MSQREKKLTKKTIVYNLLQGEKWQRRQYFAIYRREEKLTKKRHVAEEKIKQKIIN